jgi:hypothetical protein
MNQAPGSATLGSCAGMKAISHAGRFAACLTSRCRRLAWRSAIEFALNAPAYERAPWVVAAAPAVQTSASGQSSPLLIVLMEM